jgi:hypothetical protein
MICVCYKNINMKHNFILYKIDGRLNLNASIFKMSEINFEVEKEEEEMSPHKKG